MNEIPFSNRKPKPECMSSFRSTSCFHLKFGVCPCKNNGLIDYYKDEVNTLFAVKSEKKYSCLVFQFSGDLKNWRIKTVMVHSEHYKTRNEAENAALDLVIQRISNEQNV